MFRFGFIFFALLCLSVSSAGQGEESFDFSDLHDLNGEQLRLYVDSVKIHYQTDDIYIEFLQNLTTYGRSANKPVIESIGNFSLANYYFRNGNHTDARTHFVEGIEIARNEELGYIEAELLMGYGLLMDALNKKDDALEIYLKASELFVDTDPLLASDAYYTVANLQYSIENYQDAIYYGHLAKTIYEKHPFEEMGHLQKNNYMSLLNTLGISFREMDKYDSAIHYLNKSHVIALLSDNVFWQNLTKGNLGAMYLRQGKLDKALPLLKDDLEVSMQFEEWRSASNAALGIGELFLRSGQLDHAKLYFDSAKLIIDRYKVEHSGIQYLKHMSRWHEALGDFESAYQWHLHYTEKIDSLNNTRHKIELSKIKSAYDFDNKVAEIELLKKSNELQENAIDKRNIFITAAAVIIILILFMSITMYRNLRIKRKDNLLLERQKNRIAIQNEELESQSNLLSEQNKIIQEINDNLELEVEKRTKKLEQINKELDTFLYKASHDIRQPIATILGLEILARHMTRDEALLTILEKLNNTAKGMDAMLSKLQMLYQLNHGEDIRVQTDLRHLIDQSLKSYDDTIKRKNIKVKNDLENTTILNTNPTLLNIVFRNLIENAIYFGNENSHSSIHIYNKQYKSRILVTFEDNGQGIDAQYLEAIFDAYFKASERSKGNGLGLYIAQKASEALGAQITVESEPEKGSRFTVHIPWIH